MTCRAEVLAALKRLERRNERREFTLDEIVREVHAGGAGYRESTIRTHVTSRLCANAPDHHDVVYRDIERVDHGRYRRLGG